MDFIRNNSFILSVMALCGILSMTAYILLSQEEEQAVIVINNGDTLWTLADQYKGKLSHGEWIASVMDANGLHEPVITSGSKLVIPASLVRNSTAADEIYLAGEGR